jgi:hypothetical protein
MGSVMPPRVSMSFKFYVEDRNVVVSEYHSLIFYLMSSYEDVDLQHKYKPTMLDR